MSWLPTVGNQNPSLMGKGYYSIFMPCKENASTGVQQTKQWSWSKTVRLFPSLPLILYLVWNPYLFLPSELQLCSHFILSSVQHINIPCCKLNKQFELSNIFFFISCTSNSSVGFAHFETEISLSLSKHSWIMKSCFQVMATQLLISSSIYWHPFKHSILIWYKCRWQKSVVSLRFPQWYSADQIHNFDTGLADLQLSSREWNDIIITEYCLFSA